MNGQSLHPQVTPQVRTWWRGLGCSFPCTRDSKNGSTPGPKVTAFVMSTYCGSTGATAQPSVPSQHRTSVVQFMMVLLILHRQVGLAAQGAKC
jgi:hypothetical protein